MKNKFGEKLLDIWEKLKKNRRLQLLLLVAIILIVIVCYFSFKPSSKKENTNTEISSTANYAQYLEDKLENTLSSIKNVGDVNVIITLESGFEYVYATEEETKTTASGTLTTSSLVLISGQPVIVKEIYPKIKGVVVVASGAEDLTVRFDILQAIQAVLEVSNDKITILN